MLGEFFCDVCHKDFISTTDDHRAVCPTCREDVLDTESNFDPYKVPTHADFT